MFEFKGSKLGLIIFNNFTSSFFFDHRPHRVPHNLLIPFLVVVVQNPKKKKNKDDDDDDDDDGLQIVEFHHHFYYPKNFCVVVEKVVDKVVSKPKLPEEKKFLFCFAIIGIVVGVGRSEEDDSSRR